MQFAASVAPAAVDLALACPAWLLKAITPEVRAEPKEGQAAQDGQLLTEALEAQLRTEARGTAVCNRQAAPA